MPDEAVAAPEPAGEAAGACADTRVSRLSLVARLDGLDGAGAGPDWDAGVAGPAAGEAVTAGVAVAAEDGVALRK